MGHTKGVIGAWLSIGAWRGRSRLGRLLRVLVAVVAIAGMLPGSVQVLETVAHLVHDGHTPHGEAHARAGHDTCGADCGEHGCTPLQHVCKCCGSLAAAPEEPPSLEVRHAMLAFEVRPFDRFDGPERAVPPPVPPPIA